jgi:hypothetical protein
MGRGTGKSYLDAALIHDVAFRYPGIHIGLLLPELKQARKVFWEPILYPQYYGPLKPFLQGPPNRTDLAVTYCNGSRLTSWGAENADAIRGQRFGALFQDETDKIHPSVEQAVVSPTFSRSGKDAIWVKSGTPLRGRLGSLYRSYKFALDGVPGYHAIKVKSEDSPWVDQDWLEGIRRTTDPKVFRREYNVDFDAAEGLVYGDVFDEGFHVREFDPEVVWTDIIVGCDHGEESPGALLLIGILGHGADATAWVLDEVYERQRTQSFWAEAIGRWVAAFPYSRLRLYADPSRPMTIEAYRQATGIRVVGKCDNSVEDGIASVADRLLKRTDPNGNSVARIYVHPRCKNLRREFGLYRYKPDPKEADTYSNTIDKRNDHALDALRYAIFNHLGSARFTNRSIGHIEARQ